MLIHFTTQEKTWNEAKQYIYWQQRQARNQRCKEKQKANRRKSFQEQEEQGQSVVTHLQQHPQRGSHDIDECRLLSIEDSTAERRFHCIVFSTCS